MEIEQGEYFVVSRGLEYHKERFSLFQIFQPDPTKDEKPQYDRSYAGLIFRAEESISPMVVCICVGAVEGGIICKHDNVGKSFMFNQYEVELMTLSKSFVEKCGCVPNNKSKATPAVSGENNK